VKRGGTKSALRLENCAKRQTRLAPDHLFVSGSTTAAGGCIFVVIDEGGMRSGKSNGRELFSFVHQIEGRAIIIMSLRFLTAVQNMFIRLACC